MNISNLLSSTENVQIVVNGADLKEFGQFLLKEASSQKQEEPETYLSVDDVSSILKVNRSTLFRWSKSGYLIPSKVGTKSVYRKSDIDSLLNTKTV